MSPFTILVVGSPFYSTDLWAKAEFVKSIHAAYQNSRILIWAVETGNPRLLHYYPAHAELPPQVPKIFELKVLPPALRLYLHIPFVRQRRKH